MDYEDLLQESTPEIGNLVLNEGYKLPLDITFADNSGRLFFSVRWMGAQDIRSTCDIFTLREVIPPVVVTVVDREGREWKKTFGES